MAREEENQEIEIKAPKKAKEEKVSFTAWFSHKIEIDKKVKAGHMAAIKQFFFKDLGLREHEFPNNFEDGLKKFGYKS